MVAHARFCFPEEACGLLAGRRAEDPLFAYCLTNIEHSPTRFTVDPTEHFRSLRHAERNGWELVGAFHSHTHTAPYPSRTDVDLAAEPDWIWVIVGPVDRPDPEIRAYRIGSGFVREVPIVQVR